MTSHETAARTAKARKLATVLVEVAKGTGRNPSEFARRMGTQDRERVRAVAERLSGTPVYSPSETTWAEVIEMLEQSERMADALAGVGR